MSLLFSILLISNTDTMLIFSSKKDFDDYYSKNRTVIMEMINFSNKDELYFFSRKDKKIGYFNYINNNGMLCSYKDFYFDNELIKKSIRNEIFSSINKPYLSRDDFMDYHALHLNSDSLIEAINRLFGVEIKIEENNFLIKNKKLIKEKSYSIRLLSDKEKCKIEKDILKFYVWYSLYNYGLNVSIEEEENYIGETFYIYNIQFNDGTNLDISNELLKRLYADPYDHDFHDDIYEFDLLHIISIIDYYAKGAKLQIER